MRARNCSYLFSLTLLVALVPFSGCNPANVGGGGGGGGTTNDNSNDNGTDNTNDNGTDNTNDNAGGGGGGTGDPTAGLTVVKTGIEMRHDGGIVAGDDVIVFGTGGFAGVKYMIPSAGDTVAREIPDGDSFVAKSFVVAGKKAALTNNFVVTIFDTETGTSNTIEESVLRRTNLPGDLYGPHHMHADGNFIVARSDRSTDDGLFIKLIDVSDDTPAVTSFAVNPTENDSGVDYVMVDAGTNTVVAAADDSFWLYDISAPEAAPTEFPIADGISGETAPQIDGDFILFEDNQAFGNVHVLQISTGTITMLTANPSAHEMAASGGAFGYFIDADPDDSLGTQARSAIGTFSTIPGAREAAVRDFIDGSTTNNGAIGYDSTIAITDDGSLAFIAGSQGLGSGEYLQVSNGGTFSLFPDSSGLDTYGCQGSDVNISSNVVAFKAGENNDVTVGYIMLP